jgi:hypothetical protein
VWLLHRNVAAADHLEFTLGSENLTAATPTLTQEVLDRHVPCMLGGVLFHSDASITSFLEASDGKFKDLLATLVDLSIWQACLSQPLLACMLLLGSTAPFSL